MLHSLSSGVSASLTLRKYSRRVPRLSTLVSVSALTTQASLSVSLDYGVADNLINGNNGSISVGGFAGYTASSHTYGAYKSTFSYIALGGRGAFHYQFAPKLDTYAGLMVSYDIASASSNNVDTSWVATSNFNWTLFLGGRYFFTEKIGAFAELGYGFYNLNLGVTFKL